MALYGGSRDISFIRHINRELINNIIEQKVGYYKLSLDKTNSNIYGENNGQKSYNDPVLLNCLIERNEQVTNVDEISDVNRNMIFKFLRDDLAGLYLSTEFNDTYNIDGTINSNDTKGFNYNIVPEIGDIILWNEDYYEVDSIVENQLIVGKDSSYSYSENTIDFGNSLSIILSAHYTRPEKLGIGVKRL